MTPSRRRAPAGVGKLAGPPGTAAEVMAAAESEADWLEYVRGYARLRDWLTFHPLRSEGSEAGWPDLALCRPPVLALAELKTQDGRRTTDQVVWGSALARCTRLEYHLWRPLDRPIVHEALR